VSARSIRAPAVALLASAAAALALAGAAAACVCAAQPLDERLDQADAAFVGRLVDVERGDSPPRGILTFEVEQRVKGALGRRIEVRNPTETDCALDIPVGETVGVLLTRMPSGEWLGTLCSTVEPGALVAEGGEPRGGAIKVAIGIVILVLVLLFARYRLGQGTRPQLPGPPGP
jgi:hypothetical protein